MANDEKPSDGGNCNEVTPQRPGKTIRSAERIANALYREIQRTGKKTDELRIPMNPPAWSAIRRLVLETTPRPCPKDTLFGVEVKITNPIMLSGDNLPDEVWFAAVEER